MARATRRQDEGKKTTRRSVCCAAFRRRPRLRGGKFCLAILFSVIFGAQSNGIGHLKAQNIVTTDRERARDITVSRMWTTKQFLVVGIDVQNGRTQWILPRVAEREAMLGTEDLSNLSLEEILQAGYWVQSVSVACEGHDAVLILRQP